MGDTLACVLMEMRNFKAKDFALFHPAGSLGKKLVTRVKDVMYKDNLPVIAPDMRLIDAIIDISNHQIGVGVVVEHDVVQGIITDGDIRRAVESNQANILNLTAADIMTRNPMTINPEARLTQIQSIFHKHLIHSLLVVDSKNHLLGVVDYFAIMN